MIQRVNIDKIDCGDNGGCLSEFVSILVYMGEMIIGLTVITLAISVIVAIIHAIVG